MAVNERELAENAAILARHQFAADAGAMPPPANSFAYFRRRCSERYHHDFVRAPGVPGTPQSVTGDPQPPTPA
eukprot:11574759-Alexandrium_andersonii.AAC.1